MSLVYHSTNSRRIIKITSNNNVLRSILLLKEPYYNKQNALQVGSMTISHFIHEIVYIKRFESDKL